MDTKLIRALAIQLQNAAYNHGYTDAQEYGSDARYEKVYQKSLDALNTLLEGVAQEVLTAQNKAVNEASQ
jgi:hypothetical protein